MNYGEMVKYKVSAVVRFLSFLCFSLFFLSFLRIHHGI